MDGEIYVRNFDPRSLTALVAMPEDARKRPEPPLRRSRLRRRLIYLATFVLATATGAAIGMAALRAGAAISGSAL